MTFPYTTPILGILNDIEAPEARMLVVVFGKPTHLRWAYVTDFSRNFRGSYTLNNPSKFTSLAAFGCVAVLKPDGRLLVTQINISTAQYPDGKNRRWQGQTTEIVVMRKHVAGEVIAALQAKEAARVRA